MLNQIIVERELHTTYEEILDLIVYHLMDEDTNEPLNEFRARLADGTVVSIVGNINEDEDDEETISDKKYIVYGPAKAAQYWEVCKA